MNVWLKVILYFILSLIILVLPMAIYSFTGEHSLIYFTVAFIASALLSLKLGKVI